MDWYQRQEIELICGSDPSSWRYFAYRIQNHLPLVVLGESANHCRERLISLAWDKLREDGGWNDWLIYFEKHNMKFTLSQIEIWLELGDRCERIS